MPFDLDDACKGRAASEMDDLIAYVVSGAGKPRDIIKKMRIVLETHCRSAYPGSFAAADWLGTILEKIQTGDEAHPAHAIYGDLNLINDYSKEHHHGEDPKDEVPKRTRSINVSLYPKIGYDPVKSFEPITLIGTNPTVLVVNQASPYKTLQDVIAAGKAKKPLTSASAGSGTSQHLSLELLKAKAGIDITHIPYKGSGPAIQDVMAGQVDMMFDTTVVAGPHIESGKLRALAVTSAKRVPSMPNVPTVAESGVPGYEVVSWQAIFAPAGTPKAIVDRLHTEIAKILREPDMQERLGKLGMQGADMTTEQIAAFQKAEVAKWAQVIKSANIKLE